MKTLEKEHPILTAQTRPAAAGVDSAWGTQPVPLRFWLKRVLLALVIGLLTFTATEGLARLLVVLGKPTISHANEFDAKFQLAQSHSFKDQPGIFVLGDSLIDFGVYPELLSAKLRNAGTITPAMNLAVPGNTYEQDLLLLKTAIKAGNKPRLVIVNAHLRLFNQSYYQKQAKGRQLFEQSYLGRCLSGNKLPWQQSLSCQMEKNFYLLRFRNFFKSELDNLSTTVFNPKKRMATQPSLFAATEFSPEGWSPGYEVYGQQEFTEEFSKPHFLKQAAGDMSQFQWTTEHFTPLMAYCQKKHIPLLVLWMPEHPINAQVYAHYQVPLTSLTDRLNHYLAQPGVRFINLRETLKDPENFRDPEHFNGVGAVNVTNQIAQLLLTEKATLLEPSTRKMTP